MALNFNSKIYSDPDAFTPERYLDEGGKFIPGEFVNMFGLGKRRCPGEVLAKAEIFLFVASLVQSFVIKPVPGVEVSFDRNMGIPGTPKPFSAVLEGRQL